MVVVVPTQHHHFTTTTAIKISCVAIYAVLSQNQLSRDLRIFDVKFLGWKWCWCQKWQIWGSLHQSCWTSEFRMALVIIYAVLSHFDFVKVFHKILVFFTKSKCHKIITRAIYEIQMFNKIDAMNLIFVIFDTSKHPILFF